MNGEPSAFAIFSATVMTVIAGLVFVAYVLTERKTAREANARQLEAELRVRTFTLREEL